MAIGQDNHPGNRQFNIHVPESPMVGAKVGRATGTYVPSVVPTQVDQQSCMTIAPERGTTSSEHRIILFSGNHSLP